MQRLITVLTYWDDEQTMPAEYVTQVHDGYTAWGIDEANEEADYDCGTYPSVKLALDAIYRFREHQDELRRFRCLVSGLEQWEPDPGSKPN